MNPTDQTNLSSLIQDRHKKIKKQMETAHKLLADGRGILAADESAGTAAKRLLSIGLSSSVEQRIAYRRMLFSRAQEMAPFIGGVILHEETVGQIDPTTGKLVTDPLSAAGILLGVKLDKGTYDLAGSLVELQDGSKLHESATAGLDGLAERCRGFYEQGVRFAKWRCVYKIVDKILPSQLAVDVNAEILAQYAATCQANGLVPIVEPEILMDGSHCINRASEVCRGVLAAVFNRMHMHRVDLSGVLLKTNMVLPGVDGPIATVEEVANHTVQCLAMTVPPALPGIVFLSGGLSESLATVYLRAINTCSLKTLRPWRLSFSYARALQHSAILKWAGVEENVKEASKILVDLARANSQASMGVLAESVCSDATLHVKDYTY